MTLYYTLVFVLMVMQMAGFCLLVLPLPTNIRVKFLNLIRSIQLIQSLSLSFKFTIFFILILFVDSVNRVQRVQQEFNASINSSVVSAISDRSELQARRFYAQRNMYLCGFTLFLSLILNRTYTLVDELTALRVRLNAKESADKQFVTASEKEYIQEIANLEKLVAKKDVELTAIKSQADGLSREYSKISDELNEKTGILPGDKKND